MIGSVRNEAADVLVKEVTAGKQTLKDVKEKNIHVYDFVVEKLNKIKSAKKEKKEK